MNAAVEQHIAKMDIHALMDQADAPRIALPPEPPAPPESPEVAAAAHEAEAHPAAEADSAAAAAERDEARESDAANDEKRDEAQDSSAEAAPAATADEAAAADTPSDDADTAEGAHEEAANELVRAADKADPPSRPAWVDASPKRVGNTWRDVIVTDEFATKEECDREADRLLLQATYAHIQVLRQRFDRGPWPEPAEPYPLGITIDYIRREIARDEYLETVERSFGPMKKLYTLVEFTPAVDRELRARWDGYRRQARLATVGAGAGLVLGVLGLAWGLLRLDTWTRGYYTKRLFVGVPAAIIGGWLLFTVMAKLMAKYIASY
jgi:hypothetical protein